MKSQGSNSVLCDMYIHIQLLKVKGKFTLAQLYPK